MTFGTQTMSHHQRHSCTWHHQVDHALDGNGLDGVLDLAVLNAGSLDLILRSGNLKILQRETSLLLFGMILYPPLFFYTRFDKDCHERHTTRRLNFRYKLTAQDLELVDSPVLVKPLTSPINDSSFVTSYIAIKANGLANCSSPNVVCTDCIDGCCKEKITVSSMSFLFYSGGTSMDIFLDTCGDPHVRRFDHLVGPPP